MSKSYAQDFVVLPHVVAGFPEKYAFLTIIEIGKRSKAIMIYQPHVSQGRAGKDKHGKHAQNYFLW